MKELENLDWKPKWISQLGCIKGCMDFLGIKASDAWLYGCSGHAFIINIHQAVCPSGPTAWNSPGMLKLVENIGCKIESVSSHKSAADFAEKKRQAWEFAKLAIDAGHPCYGWELTIPEYFVIYGYDESHYLFKGPQTNDPTTSETKPKPWQELGEAETGVLLISSVKPAQAKKDSVMVKEAFAFALEHAHNPKKWTFSPYKTGLGAYDNWIDALKNQTANGFGVAYNAEAWHECRYYAVEFLKESGSRLGTKSAPLFDRARGHYEVIRDRLEEIGGLFPFIGFDPAHIKDSARRQKAINALRVARDAEAKGLESLEEIVKAL
jgi:hypothetical protein